MALLSPGVALLAGLALAGCVTSSSIPESANPPSRHDAAQYNLQLGIGYLRQNKLKAAQEKLEKALEQDSGLATAHTALGLVFERLEDPEGAEQHYRRAVDLDAEDPDTLNTYAVFLCSKKQKPAEALKLFDRALAIPLSRKTANRAMLYANAGTCAKGTDLPRAENYLRESLAQDPQFADALLQLSEVSFERGNGLQARGFLERHLVVAKPTPAALWLGVRIEQSLGDAGAARRYSEQLRKQFPQSVETRLMLEQERGRR